MGWVVNTTIQPLYPRERSGTHCIGGWVDNRAGLDGCGKSRTSPGFDPRTAQPVASRYSDWTMPVNNILILPKKILFHAFLQRHIQLRVRLRNFPVLKKFRDVHKDIIWFIVNKTNEIGTQCICWFYSQGICYVARSYDREINFLIYFANVQILQREFNIKILY
jgi:hypothetical protein